MSLRIILAWLWAVVVCLIVAHNGYLWLFKGFTPDTDILALLPVEERDPVLQRAFARMVDSAQQRLIVLVGAEGWTQARRAADIYRAVLAPQTGLLQSEQRLTEPQDWLAPFQNHRLILLTPGGESTLRDRSKQYWIDTARSRLYSPFSGLSPGAWRDDPFGLFGQWIQARAQEVPVRLRDGRLFVGDDERQYVVMPFTLRAPAFSIATQQALMPIIEEARRAVYLAVPQAEVIAAGVVLYAAAAAEQARLEMSTIGVGSILGIMVLLWLTFHSLKAIGLMILSVTIGCLGAVSVCCLLFERLHLLTLVFGASLIGGAVDYGTYFLCNRLAADTASMDSWQLLRRLLPPLVLTLVTTVIGYMALALTPFPGLRQMAVFSALGLIFAWLTVVFWFPSLVRMGTLKRVRLARWFSITLERWPLLRFQRSTFLAAGMFIGLTVVGLWRLGVQDDVRLLQNSPKHLIDNQIKLSRLLDAPAPSQFFIVRGATAEIVLQREEKFRQQLDRFVEKHVISGYQSMSTWVPSLQTQMVRRSLIEQKLLNDDGPLTALAQQLGENGEWVAAIRAYLRASSLPLTSEDFLKAPASEPWRHLWLGRVHDGYASVVALRGPGRESLPLLRDAAAKFDGIQWVDGVREVSSVLGRYRKYMGWVLLLSYFAVYGLLYLRYRAATWRVLAPTVCASIATLALLGITGQNLQLFHVLAFMLLLGMGVDYGIFLLEHPKESDPIAWLAVALAASSTLLSFGLLSLSKTPALQAFGVTMAIGITIVSLIVPCFRNDRVP